MVVFFLQSKDILPSVASLQQDVPEQICEGCNFAFDKERRSCGENHPELNISQLLLEFFQFWELVVLFEKNTPKPAWDPSASLAHLSF